MSLSPPGSLRLRPPHDARAQRERLLLLHRAGGCAPPPPHPPSAPPCPCGCTPPTSRANVRNYAASRRAAVHLAAAAAARARAASILCGRLTESEKPPAQMLLMALPPFPMLAPHSALPSDRGRASFGALESPSLLRPKGCSISGRAASIQTRASCHVRRALTLHIHRRLALAVARVALPPLARRPAPAPPRPRDGPQDVAPPPLLRLLPEGQLRGGDEDDSRRRARRLCAAAPPAAITRDSLGSHLTRSRLSPPRPLPRRHSRARAARTHAHTHARAHARAHAHAHTRGSSSSVWSAVAFGEIDCREGLLVAVERARYADLEAGIRTVVDIYVAKLRELAKQRRFEARLDGQKER